MYGSYGLGVPAGLMPVLPESAGAPGTTLPPGTATFVLNDGSVVSFVDWIDDKLFGSVEIANGDSSALYGFSTTLGGTIPGGSRPQTRVDTNLPKEGSNGLPVGWEALIYQIGVSFTRIVRPVTSSTATLADSSGNLSDPPTFATVWGIDRLLEMEFVYNRKTYAYGTPQDFPEGRGFYWQGTANAISVVHNGTPSPRDRQSLVLPIHMKPGETYQMIFQPEAALVISQTASDASTACSQADVKVLLGGLLKVPVR